MQARRRGELPETLVLWVNSRADTAEQEFVEVKLAEIEHHDNITGSTRHYIVSPDLVVGFDYDGVRGYRHTAISDQRSFAAKYANTEE